MSDRPNTDSQTTEDVNAILAGMALPRQLQPGYRSDLPPGLLSPSQLPPELRGTVVPPGTFRTAQADPANPPAATPPTPASTPSVTPGGNQPLASPPTPAQPPTAQSVTPGSNAPMLRPTPPIPALQPPQRPGQWQDRPDVRWQNQPPQQQVPQPIPQQQHVSDTQQKFIETYGPLAEQAGKQLGVDPRLILGQWALESGWGVGQGAAQIGNMAGIKGKDGQYTRYNSPEEFADAYVRFLRDNPRYRGAMGAGTDANKFFGGLKQAGYFGADLGGYMQGVFRNIGVFGTVAQGQGPTVQPQQSYPPAEPRDSGDWGHPPPMQGGRGPDGQLQPGQLPQPSAFGRIMNGLAPLLVGIASLALRLPLSSAIYAYGAMARAQQNGEEQEYQRNRTRWRDQLGEATAQQALESRDASDAFSEYGHNNPQGLQQALMGVALKYNDPIMYQMAERGNLNGIYQMQQRRDALNQDLTKTHKAAEEEADRQAQDNAVKAMDNQWHDKFVKDNGREPTADEAAIAHNEHIGQAGQAGTKAAGAGEQEGPVLNVMGADGKPTGQQVRTGRSGGYFDPNTKQPVQLQPGETVQQVPRQTPGTGGREGQQVYDVVGEDGKPTGRQVRLGQQGGMYDVEGNPTSLGQGEHLRPLSRAGAGGTSPEGMAVYDVVGADGRPTGKQVRMAKDGGLFDLSTPPKPVQLGEGETVRPVSRQAPPQPTAAIPDSWKGAPYGPPPGVDPGLWTQATTWAEQGRPPVGLGSRTSSMYQAVEPLVPAAMKALGIQSLAEQQLRYEAKRHALNAVETGFGSGVNGRNLISLNTVAEHIALFKQYADALRNGDVQRVNQIRNRLATEAGSPEVIDFALAGRITGDEVVRLLTTTGGTLADREDIASRLASYDSPDQFEGAANTLTNYVRGRYLPLRQQYARGDPERERYFDNNMVTPEARHLFQGPQAPIPGQDGNQQPQQPGQRSGTATPPSWADPQGQPAYLNGRTIWHKPDGKWYFEDQTPVPGQ